MIYVFPNKPANPDVGDIYQLASGVMLEWTGIKWKALSAADKTLRQDLAAVGSDVLVGGVQASIIANAALMAVYPESFYQVVDGSDDSASINRAVAYLQSLGGGCILYRARTYNLYRAIRLDSYNPFTFSYNHSNVLANIRHVGAGKGATILKAKTFWTSIFTSFPEPFLGAAAKSEDITGNNITIQDMTLDCDYDNVVDGGATYGANYATWGGTWPDGSTGASTWAADNYQYPIYAWNVDNFTVKDCEVKNSWFNGVQVYRCTNVRVLNNDISHCGDKDSYLGKYSGIELDNGTIRGLISGNTVIDCGNGLMSNGDPLPYARSSVRSIEVTGNKFSSILGVGLYAFDWIEDWIISDNLFEEIGLGGIELLDGGGADTARKPNHNTIHNNTVKNFNKNNAVGTVGIRAFGHNNQVTENKIFQNRTEVTNETYGVVVDSTGVSITGAMTVRNTVSGNVVSGKFPSTASGSHISITADNTTVEDNKLYASGAVSNQAIRIAANDVSVVNNTIKGTYNRQSGKRPIWLVSGNNFILRDNKYEPFLSITTGAALSGKVGWNVVDFNSASSTQIDSRDNFNEASNAFVADIAGIYEFNAIAAFSGLGANDNCYALFERNGAVSFGAVSLRIESNGILSPYAMIQLNVGDAITLKTYTSGASYTTDVGTSMTARYLRP